MSQGDADQGSGRRYAQARDRMSPNGVPSFQGMCVQCVVRNKQPIGARSE